MADALELPPDEQDALLTLMLREQGFIVAAEAGVRPRPPAADAPLSAQQRRLWFLDQLDRGNPSYVIPGIVRVTGPLDVTLLGQAVDALVQRHESLRTSFVERDGIPRQVVKDHQPITIALEQVDVTGDDERERRVRDRLTDILAAPFELASGPLIRAHVLRLSPDDHVVVLAMHHIVSDGWSVGVMIGDLVALYAAGGARRDPALAPLALQYPDFAVWQEQWRKGPEAAAQLAFWTRQLEGLSKLALPTDRPRPAVRSMRGGTVVASLDASVTAAVRQLGQAAGATLFMTLGSAFAALLHRYTSQEDVAIGTPSANRNRKELEPLIGFFINALVLRADLSGRPSLRELLARMRQVSLDAWAHQDITFEEVVEAIQPERSPGQNPLFQVMFVLQNAPAGRLDVAGLTFAPGNAPSTVAKFDLTLYAVETGATLSLLLEYNTDLFDAATARQMLSHYTGLLAASVAEPDRPIADLPLLSDAERYQIAVSWNDTASPYPREAGLDELFRAQAGRTPDRVALRFGSTAMTYAELEQRSNQLARRLCTESTRQGEVIGLLTERSPEAIVGILGVLKAGAAYLPLDPAYPLERLQFLLRDASVRTVVTQSALAASITTGKLDFVALDSSWGALADLRADPSPSVNGPLDLAYVMFTSGSTGTPKGVAVPHRAVTRLVLGTDYVSFAGETLLQFAPLTFDASTFEIWGALLNGGTLAIAPPGTPSLTDLGRFLGDGEVTTAWLTAGLFHQMVDHEPDALTRLHQLVAGGDVLSVRHVRRLLDQAPHLRLVNGFGPTETTTFACCHVMTDRQSLESAVPIGRPIANSRAYILDARLALVPAGVAGELYLGGDGVARGYLGRPDLTADRFIPDPFSSERGARLYRTGDRARWLRDGVVEFLGRRDRQVKIRGFRVEAGEIEAVLTAHDAVRSAAVVANHGAAGDRDLVAYVAADESPHVTSKALRAFLRARLPEYMVPLRVVRLDTLPLTTNGKLDLKALPDPQHGQPDRPLTAPRTPAEVAVARIWAEVLHLERVGVDEDFFGLGGHSLLATQVVARIRDRMGVDVPLAADFTGPTVAALARAVEQARALGSTPAAALQSIPRSSTRRLGGRSLAAHGAALSGRAGAREGGDT